MSRWDRGLQHFALLGARAHGAWARSDQRRQMLQKILANVGPSARAARFRDTFQGVSTHAIRKSLQGVGVKDNVRVDGCQVVPVAALLNAPQSIVTSAWRYHLVSKSGRKTPAWGHRGGRPRRTPCWGLSRANSRVHRLDTFAITQVREVRGTNWLGDRPHFMKVCTA
jgi:hypothetical protein